MSKELEAIECLEGINNYLKSVYDYKEIKEEIQKDINTIKQALIKTQEQDFNYKNIVIPFFDELVKLLGITDIDDMLDKIKRQNQALSIIKEKNVDINSLKQALSVKQYNDFVSFKIYYMDYMKLTQEEFDLLRE